MFFLEPLKIIKVIQTCFILMFHPYENLSHKQNVFYIPTLLINMGQIFVDKMQVLKLKILALISTDFGRF